MESISVTVGKQTIYLETGRLAKQASGAVFARYGGTSVLATASCAQNPQEGLDFVPLQVEYNEKYYAAGKIPGGFLKREARPKDKEILVSRLIDRPMRPLFSKQFMRELQIVPTVLSTDQENPPDILAIIASSAAVHISAIPFDGPIGAVRVASVDGNFLINPTFAETENAVLDIVVAGTQEGVTMVEGGAKEVSEALMLEAIDAARDEIIKLCAIQDTFRDTIGKEKLPLMEELPPLSMEKEIRKEAKEKIQESCFILGKQERAKAVQTAKDNILTQHEFDEVQTKQAETLLDNIEQEIIRESILTNKKRTDGRSLEDIRTISCETQVLSQTHGNALFTRGETQALAVITLGTAYDEQILDDIEGDRREHFMLHYNFPPFSVGETGRLSTGRREIGHGNLAQRAVRAILPSKEEFPYTLRIVSEILESNGSSSMATVCASSLAMMDAGIPIKKAVAGIAMGLITDGTRYVILSDILGEEDHYGDMDFKVAGTETGITAFQMDIKIKNVSTDLMKEALEQAKKGRLHILSEMAKSMEQPKTELSELAPRILTFQVDADKIGLLIGAGGKTIKAISEKYKVQVNIDDSGLVTVYSKDKKSAEETQKSFLHILEEPEVGAVYDGIVRRITDFGAFIEFLPGKDGLCHISRMANNRVERVSDILTIGQEVPVRIIEIDKMGRTNLSLIYEETRKTDERHHPPRKKKDFHRGWDRNSQK